MKKILLTAATAALALGANAQQTRYGIEIGAHMGNLVQELPDPSNPGGTTTLSKDHVDSRPNLGLRAGLVADFGISDNFSIQPGLHFVMKGARTEYTATVAGVPNVEFQDKLNINYVELPINVMYKTREDGTGFMVGAGPYFGYAFGGKRVMQVNDVETRNSELNFGDEPGDDIKNLDVGVGLNVGYMLPVGVFIRGYGQYGFSNIYPVPESKYETKNYGFGLSLGYMFGGKAGNGGKDDPTETND